MNIIIANTVNVINIFQDTQMIDINSLPRVKDMKFSIEPLKKTIQTKSKSPSPERLDCQKTITRQSVNDGITESWKQCTSCTYKTRFLGNMNSHIKAMHSHERTRKRKFEKYHYFQCDLCPYGSTRKQALKNHMMARHCEEADAVCPRCHTVLKNRLCVRSHLQYCGKSAIHKCMHCPFKTRYKTHLMRHLSNVHTDCNTVECPNNCGSVLKNKESLRGHLNSCGTELFSVQCRYCPFRPKRQNLLKLHEMRVHVDVTNITNQCPKCTKKFKKVAYLRKHIEICDSKPIFQCATCSYTTNKKNLLEKHIHRRHYDTGYNLEKIAPFIPCPRCGTGYKNQTVLSEHLIRCCDGVGYQCYHCPYKTKIKDHLKNHILCTHIENNELYQINMTNYIQNQVTTTKLLGTS